MDNKSLSALRINYSSRELKEKTVSHNPIEQFDTWFQEALAGKVLEPSAMALSTVSVKGRPSSRIVLLKSLTEQGFTFFTNYESRKGMELTQNPAAALTFFWPELERQIRIEGIVQKVSREESENYFNSRPRESKIGARASNQSSKVSHNSLIESYREEIERWENKEVECPQHWGGYVLVPDYFEFWQGRPSRMHDRISFHKEAGIWQIDRLAP